MKNLLVILAVVLIAFSAFGLVYGWIEYRRTDDTTTIDLHTQQMKDDVEEAADKAVDASRSLIRDSSEALDADDEHDIMKDSSDS